MIVNSAHLAGLFLVTCSALLAGAWISVRIDRRAGGRP